MKSVSLESLSLANCPISDEGLEGTPFILIHFKKDIVYNIITLHLLG